MRAAYGKFWLSSARELGGVIRINAGDAIPDFHMIATRKGSNLLFHCKLRDHLRAVGPATVTCGELLPVTHRFSRQTTPTISEYPL